MRSYSYSRSTRMWGVTVAGLCVLWFAHPAGAVPLESWDDKIPNANQRFKVLSEFGDQAVLDKETQLVWEQSPALVTTTWTSARNTCADKPVGGRKGWRLPSFPELASLVDPSVSGMTLPPGHPFLNVLPAEYWSATSNTFNPAEFAWSVAFSSGHVHTSDKTNDHQVWCVRGGMNADAY